MKGIFAYIELATSIIGAVTTLQHMVGSPAPISGAQIVGLAQPVIWSLQSLFPKLSVPMELVAQVSDAAATAINKYYKKVQV